ncbi:MAG TPA: cache domain-containing protein [Nitrososphaeraceae archaeon]|nr:cache domain-containing protein [Nitrososphaeraceae archaeon]
MIGSANISINRYYNYKIAIFLISIFSFSLMTFHLYVSEATQTDNQSIFVPYNETITESSIKNTNFTNTSVELTILSDTLETKLNKLSSLLEITSTLPQITNFPMDEFIDKKLNGIPENFDAYKRKLAKDILVKYDDFSLIGFILPNGNVYMQEPFERQKNLTTGNLGFRDYFKTTLNTGKTYLSDAIVSKSSGRSLTVMATPVFSNNQIIGVLYGTLDLNIFNELLQSFALPSNYRILIVDKAGVKLGDSDKSKVPSFSNRTFEEANKFSYLDAFNNALKGESGFTKEKIDNKTAIISYIPYKTLQNVRILLVMQECSDLQNYTENENKFSCENIENKIIKGSPLIDKNFLVNLLSLNLKEYLQVAEILLDITSKLPQISENINPNLINSTVHGINSFDGLEKRQVAKSILSKTNLFESVFLLLNNGDMYLDEPYQRQENLSRDNFVIRDYYKGVKNSNSTSLGNAIVSSATGKNQPNIAVPVFSENMTLSGIWAGGLNLTTISKIIQNFNLTNENDLILYLDENGVDVGISDRKILEKITGNQIFDFSKLRSFIDASNGNTGSTTDTILGKEYEITYSPVKIIDKTWVVLFICDVVS